MPIHENLRIIAYMARHDPLSVLGFCLLGLGGVFSSHVLLKMNRARLFGFRDWRWDWSVRLPVDYLKVRKQHGWSAWPVYLTWICFTLGMVALISGLFMLQD
jgi:hypothetical protein